MANEENLIPNSERSPSELRENGKKGGIASGESRRENKIISNRFSSFLIKKHNIKIDGQKTEINGEALLESVIGKILSRGDGASVALIKVMLEALEGNILTLKIDPNDKPVTLEDLEEILNDD